MQLGAARALIDSDPAAAGRHLSEAESLTRQAQRELSSLIQALRPADLDSRGLAAALEAHARDWSRQTGVALEASVEPVEAPPEVEQAIYRVAQEALANVGRHSGARQARLSLRRDGGDVRLSVEDDGRGFDLSAVARGVGLGSMRERVEALGGRLEIASQIGRGTSVTASCPLVGAKSEVTAWPTG
jgi:NarL family two-component system sensor histidine kinase LiaS